MDTMESPVAPVARAAHQRMEYRVSVITEGLLGTLLFSSSKLRPKRIEDDLNWHGQRGWHVVFQVIEQRRMLLAWKREAMVVTYGRPVL